MAGKMKNLKPFKKGQSGNPKGRPKGSLNRSTIAKELLEAKATDGGPGLIAHQLTRAQIRKADKGNTAAYRELMDSAYGKVGEKPETQTIQTTMDNITVREKGKPSRPFDFDVGDKA